MFKTLENVLAVCLLPGAALLCFAPEYWMQRLVKAFAMQIMAAIVLITFIWLLHRSRVTGAAAILSGAALAAANSMLRRAARIENFSAHIFYALQMATC